MDVSQLLRHDRQPLREVKRRNESVRDRPFMSDERVIRHAAQGQIGHGCAVFVNCCVAYRLCNEGR